MRRQSSGRQPLTHDKAVRLEDGQFRRVEAEGRNRGEVRPELSRGGIETDRRRIGGLRHRIGKGRDGQQADGIQFCGHPRVVAEDLLAPAAQLDRRRRGVRVGAGAVELRPGRPVQRHRQQRSAVTAQAVELAADRLPIHQISAFLDGVFRIGQPQVRRLHRRRQGQHQRVARPLKIEVKAWGAASVLSSRPQSTEKQKPPPHTLDVHKPIKPEVRELVKLSFSGCLRSCAPPRC